MTTEPNITYKNVYNRLLAQLPPWWGNQQFVAIPNPPDILTATTNFNNIQWIYLITAFTNYYQLQYDWLQTRIGQYEINNDPNWPIAFPNNYPFDPVALSDDPLAFNLLNPSPIYPIATSDNLDLIAQDFFGNGLPRRPNESDNNYRNRILSSVMKLKATRPAMLAALIALVTPAFEEQHIPVHNPEIYEYWYPFDNGGYNDYQALAYNNVGAYGTGNNPYNCIIIVYLPNGNGMENFPGYLTQGESITWGAGFGDPSITPSTPAADIPPEWYGSQSELSFYVTAQDVINLINMTKVLGTTYTLQIIYVS